MARTQSWPRVLRLPRRNTLAHALIAIAIAATAGWTGPAEAQGRFQDWRVVPGSSSISFSYVEDGAAQRGVFRSFSGTGAFDGRRPQEAGLTLNIDIESIQLRDRLRTDFVQTPAWFNSARHPRATYELRSLRELGGGRYRAVGDLTIKGRTQSITSELALDIDGDEARARGSLSFPRSAFGLGDQSLALFVDIGPTVDVTFDLQATRR